MSRAIAYIRQMPENKSQLISFFDVMKQEVLDGECDVISVSQQINCIKRLVEMYEKDSVIQDLLLSEVEKYGKGELPDSIKVKETGAKYDYSECGHVVYNRLLDLESEIAQQKKAIEATLKVRPIVETDPTTGEIFEARKAVRSSKTKVVFSLT